VERSKRIVDLVWPTLARRPSKESNAARIVDGREVARSFLNGWVVPGPENESRDPASVEEMQTQSSAAVAQAILVPWRNMGKFNKAPTKASSHGRVLSWAYSTRYGWAETL